MPKLLLLDTHVWVRDVFREFSAGQRRRLLPRINEARAEGSLRISVMSVWEVAMLESKGRIRLDMDCGAWVSKALRLSGVTVVPMSPEIAIASTRLPGRFRSDPADHIILATAWKLGALLVSADERMKEYAAQGFVDVLPA